MPDQTETPVCDSCIDVAYDEGITGYAMQAFTMMELGADLADHCCAAKDEPDLWPQCACACNGPQQTPASNPTAQTPAYLHP